MKRLVLLTTLLLTLLSGLAMMTAPHAAQAQTPIPNLVITKSTTRPQVLGVGTRITYTLRVSNTGNAPANQVVITDTLPAEVTLVAVPTSTPTNSAITVNGATVRVDIPFLNPGEMAIVTIAVEVDNDGIGKSIIINAAFVSSSGLTTANSGQVTDPADLMDASQVIKSPIVVLELSPLSKNGSNHSYRVTNLSNYEISLQHLFYDNTSSTFTFMSMLEALQTATYDLSTMGLSSNFDGGVYISSDRPITASIIESSANTPTPTNTPTRQLTPSTLTPTSTHTNTPPPTNTPTSTPSPTPTNTPTQTPIPPDAYEIDNSCPEAKSILTDSTIQEHTFHVQGDQDWVKMSLIANTTYQIEARVPSDSTADVVGQLFEQCNGSSKPYDSFSPNLNIQFKAPATGDYFIQLSNDGNATAGTSARYQLSVRALSTQPQLGAVVLVAGKLSNGDPLQDNIRLAANEAYYFSFR